MQEEGPGGGGIVDTGSTWLHACSLGSTLIGKLKHGRHQ
jgi:hypothetical protein